jgi:hypothetical protein
MSTSRHHALHDQPGIIARCRHCARPLRRCATCHGHDNAGPLCQRCSFGVICPTCQRHWTNP